jgi:4'-phosphopantetheinyl transferase
VLVGVAEAPIGVDVEALATRELAEEVSSLLHPEERGEIVAAAPEMRALVFTRLWARKEAYLKGIGIGVTGDLAADYVGSDGRAPGPAGWTVLDVPVGTGHRAAVALRSPAR